MLLQLNKTAPIQLLCQLFRLVRTSITHRVLATWLASAEVAVPELSGQLKAQGSSLAILPHPQTGTHLRSTRPRRVDYQDILGIGVVSVCAPKVVRCNARFWNA